MSCDLPADFSCCDGWDDYAAADQALAQFQAQETLRVLTGYRVGNCPVTLRQCRRGCTSLPTWMTFPVQGSSSFASPGTGPAVINGNWYNITCGCGMPDCSCTTLCEIVLPNEVASIDGVTVDGITLDPTAYRVDNGNRLVRTDGECWPQCQDMAKPVTEVGTFAVQYTPGVALDAWGQRALGTLACEYAKAACGDGKCRLPANVTQVVRQGVTLDLSQAPQRFGARLATSNPFPSGLTGIREVDAYVRRWNPYGLVAPSTVWSPDTRNRGRVTTWQGA